MYIETTIRKQIGSRRFSRTRPYVFVVFTFMVNIVIQWDGNTVS